MRETAVALLERNAAHAEQFCDRFDDLQDAQHPDAVTVSCADSRVLQDHVWGNDDPGHLFTCANIGNRVVQQTDAGEVVSGDVLYPLVHTGTETVVVLGHTGCGAVTATYDALTGAIDDEPPGIAHCVTLLAPHLRPGVEMLPDDLDRPAAINHLVEYNVDRQIAVLAESDAVPASVQLVGAVYDFQDVYGGRRGEAHVVNVDGERDSGILCEAHPEVAARIDRRWAY
ncbi:MAG: carbonic anhydrase [Halobacteriaceae archaeon]